MVVDEIAHPLGILSLHAYLRERGVGDVHLHDMRLARETPERALARVLPLRPDVIGLSSLTIERDAVHALLRLIKGADPRIVTVLGGPYPTSGPETAMRDPHLDFAVVGEGEQTFHELIDALAQKSPLSSVAGLVHRDDGKVIRNAHRETIADLDQ